jgi:Flp pilus assembly protein TadG
MVSKLADRLWRTPLPALMRRWRRDVSGATSVEFAIVATPFVLLLFGILSVCLYYFADFSTENATWQAARAMRTGQLQQSQGAYAGAVTTSDRKQIFKQAFCDRAPLFTDCMSKVIVIVQSNAGFGGITQPSCASNGVLISDSSAAFNTGAASSVILVTVCYPWDFGGKLPMFKLGNLQGGALLMQASAAFRTEPYN